MSFELIFDKKQGVWIKKPEAYGSIECATEEDYYFAIQAIKAARDAKLTDKETKAAAETFKEMFTNSTVAYKLDSRQKSIKYCCSECKGTFYMYDKYDFCPRCGKRIVGVEG